jgi:monoamine oxidase
LKKYHCVMTMNKTDVCIIGAGLSGACIARTLASHNISVLVIDARNRVGGRLLTAAAANGDLGGAWVWPRSEPNMANLLRKLNMQTAPMHIDGVSMAYTSNGKRHVIPDGQGAMYAACGNGAMRVCGGASRVAAALLEGHVVRLGMRVTEIDYHDNNEVKVKCIDMISNNNDNDSDNTTIITCQAVILAAPPKVLINKIQFVPNLPKQKAESMVATPTWMQEYGKVAVSFPTNWWRQQHMSGISIDHVGAVATWWEACSGSEGDGDLPTLAGFVIEKGAAILSDFTGDESSSLFEYIIESLKRVYDVDENTMGIKEDAVNQIIARGGSEQDGLEISNGAVTVFYKSWLHDDFTNAKDDPNQSGKLDFTCNYGDIDLQSSVEPLFFAGTETAAGAHGHMEGAVIAAERAATEVLDYLSKST